MKKGVRAGTVFFLIVATACVSAIATYYYLSMIVNDLGKNQQMYIKLDRVNEIVSQNYINRIDPVNGYTRLSDSLISGYIDGLADPYSYYLDEKNYQADLLARGISEKHIRKYGFAFCGKQVLIGGGM